MRQFRLLRLLLRMHGRGLEALERGVTIQAISNLALLTRIAQAKSEIGDATLSEFDGLETSIDSECAALERATAPPS
jgi:hypothetical protein